MSQTLDQNSLYTSFENILTSLSNKEKIVIQKRIWLNCEKETLQNIWNSFTPNITRERVRQIEDSWIKKIWRIIKASNLEVIQAFTKKHLDLVWGLLTKDKLINEIIKNFKFDENINQNVIESIVHSDFDIVKSKPKCGTQTYFHLPSISKKNIELIHKEATKILKSKKDVMDKNALYELIKFNTKLDLKNTFIDSVMDIFDDLIKWEETVIWLTKWKILNPKTLKDKAVYILKKQKTPMHFVDIANQISSTMWEVVKINTIHNELIRNTDFVLVWRWIYALKEWWIYKPGTVLDVIVDVLKKNWEPLSTEDIINKVLKVRKVKHSTIYMNLQNKDVIQRVWRNFYDIKKES